MDEIDRRKMTMTKERHEGMDVRAPTLDFYVDLIYLRRRFNDDELLIEVARGVRDGLMKRPDSPTTRRRIILITTLLEFLEQKRS
jgi:hypothetical protein